MHTSKLTPVGELFQQHHYYLFKQAIPLDICQTLSTHILKLHANHAMKPCPQCKDSHWRYDDELFKSVHSVLAESLTKKLGIDLSLTFSTVRYYPKGEVLKRHLDRDAAEYVLSVTIDFKGEQLWPLYLQKERLPESDSQEPIKSVELKVGDAVLFQGHQLYHWREALNNDWQIQAFFFFVDSTGEFAAHAGDVISKYSEQSV